MAKAPKKQGPSAQERALADVSKAQWNDYVKRFRPAEAALAKDAQLTAGERARVKGEVAADSEAAFKGLTRATVAGGTAAGAKADSSKTKLSLAANADAKGAARGVGQSIAETGAEIDAQQRAVQIAGFGRGVATDVTRNLSRGARRATQLALMSADARFQTNLARTDAISSVAGAATRKFGPGILKKFKGDAVDVSKELSVFSAFDSGAI